jgi:hypothetical protein
MASGFQSQSVLGSVLIWILALCLIGLVPLGVVAQNEKLSSILVGIRSESHRAAEDQLESDIVKVFEYVPMA